MGVSGKGKGKSKGSLWMKRRIWYFKTGGT